MTIEIENKLESGRKDDPQRNFLVGPFHQGGIGYYYVALYRS